MAGLSVALFWVGVVLTAGSVLAQVAAAAASRMVQRTTALTSAGTVTLTEQRPPPETHPQTARLRR